MTVTKKITPALSTEALLSKSRLYVHRALKRKDDNDLDEYQLWASLALELLGKAALADIHPSLIADPTHSQSLFAASGINLTTDVKTVGAHTLFERLKHLSTKFDGRASKFCVTIAERRNAELHSGEAPFRTMKVEAWEAQYWDAAYLILGIMNSSLDDWLGATQAEAPNAIVAHARQARRQAVAVRIERAKEQFGKRSKADREHALKDAEPKQIHHYRGLFTLAADREWPTKCPACGGRAFLAGVQMEEEIIDDYADGGERWESVSKFYSAEQFHCPICDLWLDGSDEVDAAGLPGEHKEVEEREMEYEADYGND